MESKSFKKLATFLNEAYSENGESINERIKKQQLKAKAHGRELSYEAAYEEVVADSMQSMFTDTNAIEKLNQLKQQDRSLWQKFMDAIQQLFEDVKALYSQYAPNSEEGKLVRSFGDKLEKLSDYYVEALNQASENMAKAKDKKAAAKGVPPVNMVVGVHEYILTYAKNFSNFFISGIEKFISCSFLIFKKSNACSGK